VKRILFGTVTSALLAIAPLTSATAETSDLEIIFSEVDQDGNEVLDLGEVLVITIEQFNQTDGDNDNLLGKLEVGDLASDPEYSDNDSNKDGALSIEEVIEEKITDFKASDTDGNGSLTFEEVKKSYESNP